MIPRKNDIKTSTKVMFSSKTVEYGTPQKLFDKLDAEFHFTLDPAASIGNAKCMVFYNKEMDGLKQDWTGKCVFLNPPFGKGIGPWIEKAYETSRHPNHPIVCIVPVRSDTIWWHKWVMKADEIRLIRGRVKYEGGKHVPPFPTAVIIFYGNHTNELNYPIVRSWSYK